MDQLCLGVEEALFLQGLVVGKDIPEALGRVEEGAPLDDVEPPRHVDPHHVGREVGEHLAGLFLAGVEPHDPVGQGDPTGVVEMPRVGEPQPHVASQRVLVRLREDHTCADGDEAVVAEEILHVVVECCQVLLRNGGNVVRWLDGGEVDDVLCPEALSLKLQAHIPVERRGSFGEAIAQLDVAVPQVLQPVFVAKHAEQLVFWASAPKDLQLGAEAVVLPLHLGARVCAHHLERPH